jgi:hypothetical protein
MGRSGAACPGVGGVRRALLKEASPNKVVTEEHCGVRLLILLVQRGRTCVVASRSAKLAFPTRTVVLPQGASRRFESDKRPTSVPRPK